MKSPGFLLICFGLGMELLSFSDNPKPGENAFLVGIGTLKGEHRGYWVPWTKLPSPVSWNPDGADCPIDLGAEVRRAMGEKTTRSGHGGNLKLTSIEIERPAISIPDLEAHGRRSGDFTNQWIVIFSFLVRPSSSADLRIQREYSVMLLDGTYADEGPLPFARQVSRGEQTARGQVEGRLLKKPDLRQETNAYGFLQGSDFPLPLVQWDALSDPFPRNLAEDVTRLKTRIMAGSGDPTLPVCLEGVEICRFTPTEAVKANGAELDRHRNHWWMAFRFQMRGKESVFLMLLDGRVFTVDGAKSDGLPPSNAGVLTKPSRP